MAEIVKHATDNKKGFESFIWSKKKEEMGPLPRVDGVILTDNQEKAEPLNFSFSMPSIKKMMLKIFKWFKVVVQRKVKPPK